MSPQVSKEYRGLGRVATEPIQCVFAVVSNVDYRQVIGELPVEVIVEESASERHCNF